MTDKRDGAACEKKYSVKDRATGSTLDRPCDRYTATKAELDVKTRYNNRDWGKYFDAAKVRAISSS